MSSIIRPAVNVPETRTAESAMDLHTTAESYRELARAVMQNKVAVGSMDPSVAAELYRRAELVFSDTRFDVALRMEALCVASSADEFII